MTDGNAPTQFQRISRWFQDHRFFSWVLLAFVVLVGVGSLTGALDNMVAFSNKYLRPEYQTIVPIAPDEILPMPRTGYGYHYYAPLERMGLSHPDTLDRNSNSKLILLEDGQPLGPAHSGHKAIEDVGEGRYSHWLDDQNNEYVYFSTSDNSDPRSNGRIYTLKVEDGVQRPVSIEPDKIVKVIGEDAHAESYRYRGAGLELSPADSERQPEISRLIVLEDGKALGPAHSPIEDVRDLGEGRYRHWHDGQAEWLFFSTSDNTDPRKNGLTYSVAVEND